MQFVGALQVQRLRGGLERGKAGGKVRDRRKQFRRGDDAAAPPVKQGDLEVVLQHLDPLAHCGRRDAKNLGGRRK